MLSIVAKVTGVRGADKTRAACECYIIRLCSYLTRVAFGIFSIETQLIECLCVCVCVYNLGYDMQILIQGSKVDIKGKYYLESSKPFKLKRINTV